MHWAPGIPAPGPVTGRRSCTGRRRPHGRRIAPAGGPTARRCRVYRTTRCVISAESADSSVLRNVALGPIKPVSPPRSPSARRAAASPTAPQGPQRSEARARLPPHAPQDATPASPAGAVGDLDPDNAVPGNDRDRDRLARSTRAGVPDAVAEDLADQQDGRVSARVPGAEYLRDECAGGTRPLHPPASVTLSQTALDISTAFPAARAPRKSRGLPGGHTGMDARLGGKRQARAPPGTGTGTPTSGYPHRSLAPLPVRYASVDPATQRPTAQRGDT